MTTTFDPGPNRDLLGFKVAVLHHFQFLKNIGFAPVRCESTLVRFESASVFVNVFHGRGSFELGVEIGKLNEPGRAYTLGDIAIVTSAGSVKGIGGGQASTADVVERSVARLAELTKVYATPALGGDPALFRRIHDSRVERSHRYRREYDLLQRRRQAERAWRAKDFGEVVSLYESMMDSLTQLESKRLSYARKHCLKS